MTKPSLSNVQMLSLQSAQRVRKEYIFRARAEACSNISTISLRVVEGGEKGTRYLGVQLGHPLVRGYTGTWPSRLGKSPIWENKIWSWVPQDSVPRMTALARPSSNCKQQTRPLVTEGAPHYQTRNCLTVTKNCSWSPDGASYQDRLAD
jgi:hypothetical protein